MLVLSALRSEECVALRLWLGLARVLRTQGMGTRGRRSSMGKRGKKGVAPAAKGKQGGNTAGAGRSCV